MFRSRTAIPLAVAAAVVVSLPLLTAGCASEEAEFDKSANYTPESLGQELIFRYRGLNPNTKTSKRAAGNKSSDAAIASRNKEGKKAATKKTKPSGPTTIDDVMDDIEHKITLVPKTTRAETTQKMVATISSDSSLTDAEKKTLTELIGRRAE
jgi:hypothetical protein